jgi:hypothetical protein
MRWASHEPPELPRAGAADAAKKTTHNKLCAMILREIAPQTEKVDTKTI